MFAQRFAELGRQADSYSLAFAFDSISLLVCFLKLFKYFRLFDQTALLWNVLSGAGKDMGFFILVLMLFLLYPCWGANPGLTGRPSSSPFARSPSAHQSLVRAPQEKGFHDLRRANVRSDSPRF